MVNYVNNYDHIEDLHDNGLHFNSTSNTHVLSPKERKLLGLLDKENSKTCYIHFF